jgi:hypothetical protein
VTRTALPRLLLAALAAPAFASLALTTTPPAGANTPSATQLLNQAIAAADAKGTLTFSDTTRSGKNLESLTGAVSAPTAVESLTGTGEDPLQVMLIGNTAYVKAGQSVLQGQLGLPAAAAAAHVQQWISVQSGDSAFEALTGQLTILAELNSYVPVAHIARGKVTKLNGKSVIPITGQPASDVAHGATSGAVALLVSTAAPHLPVGGTLVLNRKGSPGLREAAAFSNWGNKIVASPPMSAVAFSSLVAH